jgi:hypothetical protein
VPVALDLRAELLHERRTLGARTHQRHVAAQHVPQLRQLVQAGAAQDLADTGDAVIGGDIPRVVAVGVDPHGAELQQLERMAVLADPDLAEQHRPWARHLDRHGQRRQHRCRQDQQQARHGDVEGPLGLP